MSESAKKIIKYFCDRFLKIDYYPTSINAIFDIEIGLIKGFDDKTIKILTGSGVKLIGDFSKLTLEEIEKLVKEKGIDASILQSAFIAASLIVNAWKKRTNYLKKSKMKVLIAGLDNAGKTSLINRLTNVSYMDIVNLEPTVGANIEEFQSEKLNLIIWDLGGQSNHIKEYLTEPEKFFVQIDVLIFVVDSQDDGRYDQAIKYLSDIIDILDFLNEFPFLMILLNKADSDIVEDPDYRIKLEYLTEQITEVFTKREKAWQFEITPTSIYNLYANQPEIVRDIKDIFSFKKKEESVKEKESVKETELSVDASKKILEKTVEQNLQIESKLQKILEINLQLMEKVATELSDIKRVLRAITPSDLSKSLFSIPFEKVPLEFISSLEVEEEPIDEKKKKEKTRKEPKEKKRKESIEGPPKRLEVLPTSQEKSIEGSTLKDGITKQIKEKTLSSQIQSPSSAQLRPTELTSLRPPLPPPPPVQMAPSEPSIRAQSAQANRAQIISELKEIFIKRGIVK